MCICGDSRPLRAIWLFLVAQQPACVPCWRHNSLSPAEPTTPTSPTRHPHSHLPGPSHTRYIPSARSNERPRHSFCDTLPQISRPSNSTSSLLDILHRRRCRRRRRSHTPVATTNNRRRHGFWRLLLDMRAHASTAVSPCGL